MSNPDQEDRDRRTKIATERWDAMDDDTRRSMFVTVYADYLRLTSSEYRPDK